MSPEQIQMLAPLVVFAVCAFIVSIPVIAFSARYAVKPVVEALIRLRESQGRTGASNEMLTLQDRRLSLLESEMQHIGATLERLVEAQDFHGSLGAGAPAAGLPAAKAARVETPAA